MSKVNVYIKMKYNTKAKGKEITVQDTNIKDERIKDFLLDWLSTQVGQGKDTRKANVRESYEVTIECDLNDDTFYVQSDTGNNGLTCGIVMGVVDGLGRNNERDTSGADEGSLQKV